LAGVLSQFLANRELSAEQEKNQKRKPQTENIGWANQTQVRAVVLRVTEEPLSEELAIFPLSSHEAPRADRPLLLRFLHIHPHTPTHTKSYFSSRKKRSGLLP
jgi:hypothetical protein